MKRSKNKQTYDIIFPYLEKLMGYKSSKDGDFTKYVIGIIRNSFSVREELEEIPDFIEDDEDLKTYKAVQEMVTASYVIKFISTEMKSYNNSGVITGIVNGIMKIGRERGWTRNQFMNTLASVMKSNNNSLYHQPMNSV